MSFWSTFSEAVTRNLAVPELVDAYELCATEALNVHAPLRRKKITIRSYTIKPSTPTIAAKKKMREAEHTWRETRLTIHRDIFKAARNKYVSMIRKESEVQLKSIVSAKDNPPRKLWSILAERTGPIHYIFP
jgi:hypothetical protein